MNEIFKNGSKITTISFDGWQLPNKERQLLIDFANGDYVSEIYTTNCDGEITIFVDTALEYGLDDETIEKNLINRYCEFVRYCKWQVMKELMK